MDTPLHPGPSTAYIADKGALYVMLWAKTPVKRSFNTNAYLSDMI